MTVSAVNDAPTTTQPRNMRAGPLRARGG
jgi:hypothetical protein